MNILINIAIVFILGIIGGFIRVKLLEKLEHGLIISNLLAIVLSYFAVINSVPFVAVGLAGSISSLSAVLVKGKKYTIITTTLCILTIVILKIIFPS